MSNIIDFNDLKQKAPRAMESGAIPGTETGRAFFAALDSHFAALPQDEIMHQTYHAVSGRLEKLLLLSAVASKAGETLAAQGFPSDQFDLDEASIDAFIAADIESDTLPKMNDPVPTDLLWNGPRFDYTSDNGTVTRLASTVMQNESGTVCTMDILRMRVEDDEWSLWNNGEWVPGPPDGFFEERDIQRLTGVPDWDDNDEYYVGDGWDDDEEIDPEDEDSLWAVGIPSRAITALEKAGIRTVADLIKLSLREVRSIKGIGDKSLAEIVFMLGNEGYEMRP